MKNSMTIFTALMISACSHNMINDTTAPIINDSHKQLIVVIADNDTAIDATLYRFEKSINNWQQQGSEYSVVIGRTGLAWGKGLHPKQPGPQKQEGDGKAPAGIFELGTAFGYLSHIQTNLPYQSMTANDYCIDVKGSVYYNQLVNKSIVGEAAVKDSSEWMRRDIYSQDNLYKKGIVVKHNNSNIDGAGSCIFLHLWREKSTPTAGCTAMSEENMDSLLAWLDERKKPLFISLTKAQYQQKQSLWQLPKLINN
ncbi:L,D-transpeptidase [Pseudoalteromonas mariniglutinosa]|uniref:L,D-transpeptidase family protein n=1 Tax=Pseudoalteromonas mariniglutinosa TaxID=206042 RepID=UPI00384B4BE5